MELKSYWKSLWAVLFPPLCVGCGETLLQHEELLCISCEFHLPTHDFHLFPDNAAVNRLTNFVLVDRGLAYMSYSKSSIVQSIIHQLKYKNQIDVAYYFGRLLGEQLQNAKPTVPFDYIVPIPLHPKKKRKRGYNQAAAIAEAIALVLKIPVSVDNLIRLKNTVSQTGLSDFNRLANVEKAFFCRNPLLFAGKHILLVDDVLTTGATIYGAAIALKEIEGLRISVATLALA